MTDGAVLFVHADTAIDLTRHTAMQGRGRIDNDGGFGCLAHSCLALVPTSTGTKILGLASQSAWTRQHPPARGNAPHSAGPAAPRRTSGPRALPATASRSTLVREGSKRRQVEVALAWTELEIQPARLRQDKRSPLVCVGLRVWNATVEWLLVTTLPVADQAAAQKTVDWSALRGAGGRISQGVENRLSFGRASAPHH